MPTTPRILFQYLAVLAPDIPFPRARGAPPSRRRGARSRTPPRSHRGVTAPPPPTRTEGPYCRTSSTMTGHVVTARGRWRKPKRGGGNAHAAAACAYRIMQRACGRLGTRTRTGQDT
eukprot:4135455-Prymnesium_polylepis.1